MSALERTRRYRAKWPDKARALARKSMFKARTGIVVTEELRHLLEQTQDGVCAICGKPETMVVRGAVVKLAVDHDHQTNSIRGLLCRRCNTGIGCFDDNPELLKKAIAYLDASTIAKSLQAS